MKVHIYGVKAKRQAGNIRAKYIMTKQKGQSRKKIGILGISSREFTHHIALLRVRGGRVGIWKFWILGGGQNIFIFREGEVYFLGGGCLIWHPCAVSKARFENFLPAAHSIPFHIFRFKLCVTDETM